MLSVTIAVIIVLGVIALVTRPARVDVDVTGEVLVVRPRGMDKLWCVSNRVEVPVSTIRTISVERQSSLSQPWLKFPGAFLPGIIRAGSYGLGDERSFWDVRRAEWVLVIECEPDGPYYQVVLELPDPQATARRLRGHLAPYAR